MYRSKWWYLCFSRKNPDLIFERYNFFLLNFGLITFLEKSSRINRTKRNTLPNWKKVIKKNWFLCKKYQKCSSKYGGGETWTLSIQTEINRHLNSQKKTRLKHDCLLKWPMLLGPERSLWTNGKWGFFWINKSKRWNYGVVFIFHFLETISFDVSQQ